VSTPTFLYVIVVLFCYFESLELFQQMLKNNFSVKIKNKAIRLMIFKPVWVIIKNNICCFY